MVEGPDAVPTRSWHHLAAVFDGEEMRLYLDGRRIAAEKAKGKRTTNAFPLYVGAEPAADGRPNFWFDGALDEVRVSKTARYEGESFEPERRHEPDADTVLLLHLDGTIGPFHLDSSPGAAHAHEVGRPRLGKGRPADGE
jgi:hypothetical protein